MVPWKRFFVIVLMGILFPLHSFSQKDTLREIGISLNQSSELVYLVQNTVHPPQFPIIPNVFYKIDYGGIWAYGLNFVDPKQKYVNQFSVNANFYKLPLRGLTLMASAGHDFYFSKKYWRNFFPGAELFFGEEMYHFIYKAPPAYQPKQMLAYCSYTGAFASLGWKINLGKRFQFRTVANGGLVYRGFWNKEMVYYGHNLYWYSYKTLSLEFYYKF